MKLLIMQFSPITSSVFGPNTLPLTLFTNTSSLCSSLNGRDQVSHPHKTKGKIISFVYFNFYIFRQTKRQKVLK
jgi:hypothetical protein